MMDVILKKSEAIITSRVKAKIKNLEQLKCKGLNVLIVYSCELKKDKQKLTLNKILNNIQNQFQN